MNSFKRARLLAGHNVEWVAEQLRVTRQTVYNWEKGFTEPSNAQLLTLSRLYSMTVDELLRGVS